MRIPSNSVSMDTWPNELLLEIFPYLPLKALIATRGVCKRWRYLVPQAMLHPARQELLKLYDDALASPDFLPSRVDVVQALEPGDREAYLSALVREGAVKIPQEFEYWVREWPAKAVVGGIWPWLKGNCLFVGPLKRGERYTGYLTYSKPGEQSPIQVLGLMVYSHWYSSQIWIILDGGKESEWLDGRVLRAPDKYNWRGYWDSPKLTWVEWLRDCAGL